MVLKLLYSFCFEKIIETLILNLALLKYLEITLYNLGQCFGGKRWNSELSKPKNLKSMEKEINVKLVFDEYEYEDESNYLCYC